MKDVPKKHLPEVSGGVIDGGCIPDPFDPQIVGEPEYPQRPGGPFIDQPYPYVDASDQT